MTARLGFDEWPGTREGRRRKGAASERFDTAISSRKNNPDVDRKEALQANTNKEHLNPSPPTPTSRHTLPNQIRKSRALTQDRFAGAVLAEVPLNGRMVVARKGVVDEVARDLLVEAVSSVEAIDRCPKDLDAVLVRRVHHLAESVG